MKFLLGTKEYMTTVFDEGGQAEAVTVIAAGPMTVTGIRTSGQDGYAAVQWGAGARRVKNLSRPVRGHLRLTPDAKVGFRYLREARLGEGEETSPAAGDTVAVDMFAAGDLVKVSSISKGKGFQGVVKRHGFHGGPRTHGQKHSEREPGSIGGGLRTRVPKAMRMGGRMGGQRVTVRNLKVMAVDKEANRLYLRGAVPGRRGTLVEIHGK